jgi:hypothetical protein
MRQGRRAFPSAPDGFRVQTTDRYPQWVGMASTLVGISLAT